MKMKPKLTAVVTFFALIVTILSPMSVKAQAPSPAVSSPIVLATPSPTTPIDQLVTENEIFRYWREAAKGYESRVDQERQNFYAYSSLWVGIITLALALGGGLTIVSIIKMARKKLSQVVDDQAVMLEENIQKHTEEQFHQELCLPARILIIVDESRVDQVEKLEAALIRNRGFESVMVATTTRSLDADLVIFEYADNSAKQQQLSSIVKRLKKAGSHLPLIAYFPGRVSESEFDSYPLRAYANTPLTLVSWTFSILASYRKEQV